MSGSLLSPTHYVTCDAKGSATRLRCVWATYSMYNLHCSSAIWPKNGSDLGTPPPECCASTHANTFYPFDEPAISNHCITGGRRIRCGLASWDLWGSSNPLGAGLPHMPCTTMGPGVCSELLHHPILFCTVRYCKPFCPSGWRSLRAVRFSTPQLGDSILIVASRLPPSRWSQERGVSLFGSSNTTWSSLWMPANSRTYKTKSNKIVIIDWSVKVLI